MFNSIRLKFAFLRLRYFLKGIKNKSYTVESIMQELFSKKLSLIQPWQYESEFIKLLEFYSNLNPQKVMEIGTANGGTLFAHCKLAKDNATIISVDLPGGKFGGGYPEWKTAIYMEFAKSGQKLHLIRGNSHAEDTVKKVKDILRGELLDYLFIDGDHTYDGVKKDFDTYFPFVKSGGGIIFHDIALHPQSLCQVDKFWNDIKSGYKYHEFIKDVNSGKYGIGVIVK
jgi:predicted O-methyltransferase YrrM